MLFRSFPVTNPAVVIALLAVRLTTSGRTRSHGVTGGEIAAGGVVNVIYDGTARQLVGSGGGGAEGGGFLYENTQTLTSNYTVTTGKNAMSTGPVSIASGVTLTIPSGSRYVVL